MIVETGARRRTFNLLGFAKNIMSYEAYGSPAALVDFSARWKAIRPKPRHSQRLFASPTSDVHSAVRHRLAATLERRELGRSRRIRVPSWTSGLATKRRSGFSGPSPYSGRNCPLPTVGFRLEIRYIRLLKVAEWSVVQPQLRPLALASQRRPDRLRRAGQSGHVWCIVQAKSSKRQDRFRG